MQTQIGTLVVATSLIQFANGFFGTFISLRVAIEAMEPPQAGLVLSAYFVGFTLAALRASSIIARIGHIRAYAAFASLAVAATAAMPLLGGAYPWMALRAVIGFGCAGIFITTESWLGAKASPERRGRVFATYMVGTFVALALGQLVIGRIAVDGMAPFSAIVVFFALSLALVSTTRAEPPRIGAALPLPWGQLSRSAPVAVAGALLGGIVTSCFYALVPAWMQLERIPHDRIALVMLAGVLGGLAFQVPVGRISDRFDRRLVLAGLALGVAACAIVLAPAPRQLWAALPLGFLLGGAMSTIYPVCVAHAHDRMPADRVVAVSSRLILVSGAGSVIGPLLGSAAMARHDIDGVLWVMAGAGLLLAAIAGGRALVRKPPAHAPREFELLDMQAAPLAPTVRAAE